MIRYACDDCGRRVDKRGAGDQWPDTWPPGWRGVFLYSGGSVLRCYECIQCACADGGPGSYEGPRRGCSVHGAVEGGGGDEQ